MLRKKMYFAIINYETNFRCSDILILFCISFKTKKKKNKKKKNNKKKKTHTNKPVSLVKLLVWMTIRANAYGDKDAGSMPFVLKSQHVL